VRADLCHTRCTVTRSASCKVSQRVRADSNLLPLAVWAQLPMKPTALDLGGCQALLGGVVQQAREQIDRVRVGCNQPSGQRAEAGTTTSCAAGGTGAGRSLLARWPKAFFSGYALTFRYLYSGWLGFIADTSRLDGVPSSVMISRSWSAFDSPRKIGPPTACQTDGILNAHTHLSQDHSRRKGSG
jgi:hypothetical protein